MKYKDLNLKKLREENGLDFAHFTYLPGQCSCCYGPLALPARYWHRGIKPATMENVQYLLFKNADNGSGSVHRNDDLDDVEYIEWGFPLEKLDKVCEDLQTQLGKEYVVLVPKDITRCISVVRIDREDSIKRVLSRGSHLAKGAPIAPDAFSPQDG